MWVLPAALLIWGGECESAARAEGWWGEEEEVAPAPIPWDCKNCTPQLQAEGAELTNGESRSKEHTQTVREPWGDARNDGVFCLPSAPPPPAPIWDSREVSGAFFRSPGFSKITEMLSDLILQMWQTGEQGESQSRLRAKGRPRGQSPVRWAWIEIYVMQLQ